MFTFLEPCACYNALVRLALTSSIFLVVTRQRRSSHDNHFVGSFSSCVVLETLMQTVIVWSLQPIPSLAIPNPWPYKQLIKEFMANSFWLRRLLQTQLYLSVVTTLLSTCDVCSTIHWHTILSKVFGNFWPFFQKHICEFRHWCWRRRPAMQSLIHPKGVLSGWSQDSVQASQVLPHQTCSSMSLWTLLCALVRSHVGTGRGHPQTVSTKLGAWNCPKSLGMLKHSEFLSLELRGQVQLLKNNPPP